MMPDWPAMLPRLVEWISGYRIGLLFVACAGLGALGAWLVAGMPFRERLLDAPNERSSHTIPTPRGGGVGILAAFIVAGLTLRIPTAFLFAAVLIAGVSLYGDYKQISVKHRLIAQAIAASLFLFSLLPRLAAHYGLSTPGGFPYPFFLVLPLIALFLVGTANLFNFMDGIDGIAGLSGMIAFGLLGLYTLSRLPLEADRTSLSYLSLCVALACLGYLPFNMPRARVFMGDVGSVLLGFVFAALAVTLAGTYREMVCFASLLFPFYADELTTMAVRLRDRESLTRSHRRHLYQILVNEGGIAHWKITLMYGAAQLAVAAGVLAACSYGLLPVVLYLLACFIGFTILSLYVRNQYRAR